MQRLSFHIIAVIVSYFLNGCIVVHSQTVCNRPANLEWHLQPQTAQVKWTLMENICESMVQCWGDQERTENQKSDVPPTWNLPQICPLEVQFGVKLFVSIDATLDLYGIRILNVSKEDFESCSTAPQSQDQFLCSDDVMNASRQVQPKWLLPGLHYFIASHEGNSQLCKLGLRLNVSVKEQQCRSSPLVRLCSGNGVCRTSFWEYGVYRCQCRQHYSGKFCEKFDACLENPCENKGVCVSNGTTDHIHATYKCLCPPHFTGANCSDVIGRENCDRFCRNGTCLQVSPFSFKCVCYTGHPGPPCGTSCDPNPCRNGGECEESSESAAGYACACLEGFTGLRCDTPVNINCLSYECQREKACSLGEHTSPECAASVWQCSDGTTGPQCRRQRGPCSPSPCHNNASCLVQGEDYVCRCLPGFSGKSCEEIIDYCSLLSVNCLHQGLCLSVIGGYNCLCAPGWIGEFCQYGGNACLIYPDSCMNGATCITTSQPTAPPQYRCICSPGYTGPHCETEINQCFSNPCLHNGTCLDSVGFYKCRCLPGFLGQKCEVDVDACTLPNTTCPRNTHCLDLPDGLKYTCRLLCPPNIQPCANGGRCVWNNDSSYTCVCAPGWAGRNCHLNINDCVQHWCRNGATCVDEIDGYSCLCPRGYSGSYCEMDVDNCIGHHCSEHGVCLDQQYNYTCRCELGFQGSYCEQETDECKSSPCVNGATCEDVIGGYQCHCPPGFEGRWCSENVNDCWSRPCLNGGSCMDLLNGYICHCPFGFGGPFCEVNLNDCKSMPCQNGAVCVDGVDLYHCFCPAGFQGLNCEINYDECVYGFCANNSTCVDLVADYGCICPVGFVGKNCSTPVIECASGDGTKCKNGGTCYIFAGVVHCTCPPGWGADDCSAPVNQCVLNPCDPEGTLFCEELPKGFKCVCQHGYMGRLCQIPRSHCVDGLCHRGSKCVDLPRGFKCHCLPGLTGQFCDVNIDDCEEKPCGVLSICKDTINGYNCFCAPGFIGNNCEVEVNECLSQPCHNGASCSDELNAFSCLCPIGVTGNYCEINIDECLSGPCRHNSTCLDLANGYECVCLPGFTGAGCEFDIDECASSPCKNGATCIDQPGNYHCQCVAPFKGRHCEFLPCEANNPCENGAECVEEPDQVHFPLGFRCRCRRGFTGPRCEINMDECSSNPCLHGFCYDVVDGFYCLCNPGYAGVRCEQDIDDCASNMCSNNSTCRDLHLSYECLCVPGWEGEFCQQEIDECSSQPCLNNATCTDLLNSYQCLCPQGWVGVDCSEDVDECDSGPCLNGAQCQESPLPGEFSCTCPPFFSGPLCNMPFDPCDPAHDPCLHNATCLTRSDGTAACRCRPGFQGTSCEIDTDECISGPCQNQGHCLDRVNSYSCDCAPGFSGRHCEEDINECASRPCQNGGICQDQVNRFHCNCPAGYFGTMCDLDINECEVSPCLHEAVCINKPGGFKCVCRPGNAGTWCELSVDECVSNPCQNGGSCVDGPNRYQCLCAGGFMGFHCETNFDECMSGPCLHGRCIDGVDVYYCQCELGWTGARCEMNIDECSSSPCLNGGSCVDLIDKYACFCLDGYTGKNCDIDIDVCLETPTNVTLCLNGGTCLDGQGSNFTCSCPAGFIGDFCEMDVNECCSDPCLHGAICRDLLNGYLCHCRAGWTGLHCELDINECLPQPCNQGMCIQNEPGYGYTCFCRPGFVGRNCEHNYDDCLLQPCPGGSSCVDGINEVSCQPVEGDMSSVPWEPSITQTPRGSLLTTSPMSPYSEQPTDSSYVQYSGNSYLEFEGIDLGANNNITVRFQTQEAQGTILYVDQGAVTRGFFFMKLFIQEGMLQYVFSCSREEGIRRINTSIRVDDGNPYIVYVRQQLAPCEAEVVVSGYERVRSQPSNYWSGLTIQRTSHLFIGGLPRRYLPYQGAQPFSNYTGCVEIIEINKLRGFYTSSAVAGSNVDNCRSRWAPPGTPDAFTRSPYDWTTISTTLRGQGSAGVNTSVWTQQPPSRPPPVPTSPWQPAPSSPWQPAPSSPWQPAPSSPWQPRPVSTSPWQPRPVPTRPRQPSPVPTRPRQPSPVPTRPRQPSPVPTRPRQPSPVPTRPRQPSPVPTSPWQPSPVPTRPWQPAPTRPLLPIPTRPWQTATTHSPPPAPTQPPIAPTQPPPPVCHAALCLNGGTCHELQRPSGALSFYCDCPLHFTGRFCEKDTTIFIPSFNGTSYLELPPLGALLQSPGASADPSHPAKDTTVTLYLTVKTRATQGTILYTREENLGDRFLHVFLQDGIPVVKLGCSGVQVLNANAGQTINTNRQTSIRIRYGLPVGRSGGSCMIEIAVDNGTVKRQEESLFQPVSEVALGPIFLGDVPSHRDQPASTREVTGFVGCIRELQVNNKDIYIAGEALGGRNIHNCDTPVCQHLPCRNGGTCVSDAEDWFCECPPLYSGRLCQFTACEWSPCGHGATCIPKSHQEAVCLCPYGRQGLLCDDAINITRARFSGKDEFGYTSFIAYSSIPSLSVYYEFQLKLTFADRASALKDNLILFSGQKGQGIDGDDFLVLGVRNGRIVHKFNLGSGVGTMVSDRLNREIDIHTVNFGRSKRTGWLKVDGQRNRTGSSPGHLAGLNAQSQVFVGGYNEYTPELLPLGSRFRNGFQGCIFDLEFRTRRDGKFIALGKPEGHPNSGRSVGQCGVTPCTLVTCRNGGTCVDSGSSVYCQCPFGWKGALCSETVSVCDAEHRPPPLCARGSTCIPLPDGYTCLCPLGTGGLHCQQAMAISDPFFSGNQSSWMSFPPVSIRHRTDLKLQFQTLSPEGIVFYTAQHLSARAGDFFCVSLTSGLVQLRYNLGSGTNMLQSTNRVDTSGGTWHTVRAGRTGHQGYLVLDGLEVKQNNTEGGMSTLDVATDLFVGGVSDLSSISTFSVENEPVGFTGGVRELVLNGHDFDLTATGALGGANVGDWDGTACGYKVCQNGGRCTALSGADSDSFMCTCPPRWTGPVCNQAVDCVNNLCQHESLCFADLVTGSYDCFCPLGWEGRYCDKQVGLSMTTLKFVGKSYLKYRDPKFNTRNLRYTQVSFNFTASGNEGLILWMGRAAHDDDDYLAVGLQAGHLRIAVNLGERLSLPLTFRNVTLCCNTWHYLSISLNSTIIQAFLGDERVLFEDVDPFERYVAMNYGGLLYLGGFELHRNISTVTSGLFTKGFVGDLKDVRLYQDPRQLQFLQNSEGFNVHKSNE